MNVESKTSINDLKKNPEIMAGIEKYEAATKEVLAEYRKDPVYAQTVTMTMMLFRDDRHQLDAILSGNQQGRAEEILTLLHSVNDQLYLLIRPEPVSTEFGTEGEGMGMKVLKDGIKGGTERQIAKAAEIIDQRRAEAMQAGISAKLFFAAAEIINKHGGALAWIATRTEPIEALMWVCRIPHMQSLKAPTTMLAELGACMRVVKTVAIAATENAKEAPNTYMVIELAGMFIEDAQAWITDSADEIVKKSMDADCV